MVCPKDELDAFCRERDNIKKLRSSQANEKFLK